MSHPQVTVAMGIYNCASTLEEAAQSILQQKHKDLELILCDDGSTDNTLEVARKISETDDRVRVIKNGKNLGLNHALNHCLKVARGKYYARMDGDDTCVPDRISKLVSFMEENPRIALVSSWMKPFDQNGEWGMIRTKPNPTAMDFLRGSPFCHAPCMMRIDILRSLGGYSTEPFIRRCEDLDLWFRLYAAGHKGANLQEPLYSVRDDRNARRRRTFISRVNEARVKLRGYAMLRLPIIQRYHAFSPILVGLLPGPVYDIIHRWRRRL